MQVERSFASLMRVIVTRRARGSESSCSSTSAMRRRNREERRWMRIESAMESSENVDLVVADLGVAIGLGELEDFPELGLAERRLAGDGHDAERRDLQLVLV